MIKDTHHTIQLERHTEEIRFSYRDPETYWTVGVYCSLTKSYRQMAQFSVEADAVRYSCDKSIDLEIPWERKD